MSTSPFEFQLDLSLVDNPTEDLRRKIAFLLTTQQGTLPLNRGFGIDFSFLDYPTETARSLFTAEVTLQIATYLPEVRVKEVDWTGTVDGTITPKVVITSV